MDYNKIKLKANLAPEFKQFNFKAHSYSYTDFSSKGFNGDTHYIWQWAHTYFIPYTFNKNTKYLEFESCM